MKIKISKYWTVLETEDIANYTTTYVACKPSCHIDIDIQTHELSYLEENCFETHYEILKVLREGLKGDNNG